MDRASKERSSPWNCFSLIYSLLQIEENGVMHINCSITIWLPDLACMTLSKLSRSAKSSEQGFVREAMISDALIKLVHGRMRNGRVLTKVSTHALYRDLLSL